MFRFSAGKRSAAFCCALRAPAIQNVRFISRFLEWPVSPVKISSWGNEYLMTDRVARVSMQQALLTSDPHFKVTGEMLKTSKNGLRLAMTLRADINFCKKNSTSGNGNTHNLDLAPLWKNFDRFLKDWLGVIFCESMLELRQITMDSASGEVLEYIVNTEAVHPVRSVADLKNRLTNGRCCYGLFHSSSAYPLPLAYIHVGLLTDYASSVQ